VSRSAGGRSAVTLHYAATFDSANNVICEQATSTDDLGCDRNYTRHYSYSCY